MCKKNFILAVLMLVVANIKAQTILDSAKSELYKVNKIFDSSTYIGFDVDILYYTDTAYGSFQRQEQHVEYYLNNKNYYYKLDETESIQNDSFTIDIDHAEKNLIVTKSSYSDPSGRFALKDFLNYSVDSYASVYTVDISMVDSSLQKITFNTVDTTQPYKSFAVTYSPDTYHPIKMEIELTEKVPVPTLSNAQSLTQKLAVSFSNYHSLSSSIIFDEKNYFFFDITTKQYQPVDKYKYYRFMIMGVEQEELPQNPQLLKEN